MATNSLWDYTHVIMNFLLGGRIGNERSLEWLEFFDVVICGETCFNVALVTMDSWSCRHLRILLKQ